MFDIECVVGKYIFTSINIKIVKTTFTIVHSIAIMQTTFQLSQVEIFLFDNLLRFLNSASSAEIQEYSYLNPHPD